MIIMCITNNQVFANIFKEGKAGSLKASGAKSTILHNQITRQDDFK